MSDFLVRTGSISTKAGAENPACGDTFGSLFALAQGGKHQAACDAGRLFVVANQAAVATTAALATTWTGLGVANPTGSGYKLIFHQFGWSLSLAGPAAGSVGLATTTDSGFAAAIVPRNRKYGGAASIAFADDGATVAAPVLEQVFGSYGTAATTAFQTSGPFLIDLAGSLILLPGRSVVTYTTTACTAAFSFHFMWEEVAL